MTEGTNLMLEFRPLGPLMLRGPGEFDLSSRGTFSGAASMILPTPTTVLGAYLSNCIPKSLSGKPNIREGASTDPWIDLVEALRIVKAGRVRAMAIYIADDDGHIYLPLMGRIVPLGVVRRIAKRYAEGPIDKPSKIVEWIDDEAIDEEFKVVERVGIGLRTREPEILSKMVREHLIYSVRMVAYPPGFSIRAQLYLDGVLGGCEEFEVPVRLGGEGRGAILEVRPLRGRSLRGGSSDHFLTLTHLLLTDRAEVPSRTQVIAGRFTTIGGGFSSVLRVRRPMYRSIAPGSLVRITDRGTSNSGDDFLVSASTGHGIYSMGILPGSNVGFNTLLRL